MWDEFRWEQLLTEREKRAEACLALLEKYASHPNREEIVANKISASPGCPADAQPSWDVSPIQHKDSPQVHDIRSSPGPGDAVLQTEKENWERVRQNAAYRAAHGFCCEIHEFLPESDAGAPPPRPIIALLGHAYNVPAKIAGGLAGSNMGEVPDMTIAYYKRALAELNMCLACLRSIENQALLPLQTVHYLQHIALKVREVVLGQVAGLRARRHHSLL